MDRPANTDCYTFFVTNPYQVEDCACGTVTNALAAAAGISWKAANARLLQQAHADSRMPSDPECIRSLLWESGFRYEGGPATRGTVAEFCRYASDHCTAGETFVLQLSGSRFTAVLPGDTGDGGLRYRQCDAVNRTNHAIMRCYALCPGETAPYRPRRKRTVRELPDRPPQHDTFRFFQPNPRQLTISDCTVRAVAGVLRIGWDEALDRLAACADKGFSQVNDVEALLGSLPAMGFLDCGRPQQQGKSVSGTEFCRMMERCSKNGDERFFVFFGRSHVAAVLPDREEGALRYRIHDSWDSTGHTVTRYWVMRARL